MARLTITLSDERRAALKETAASSGKTITQLIDESLDAYGIKTRARADQLLAEARQRAGLDESSALELAVEETAHARRQK
tara:strand:- start:198 stop:437 length:240 start_codon:yes stop_codon:yes gene_type:complete